MNINYNFDGYIINLFPPDDDSQSSIQAVKEWKSYLDGMINQDLERRQNEDDANNSASGRRQILSKHSKHKLKNEIKQHMMRQETKSTIEIFDKFMELLKTSFFIIRTVKSTQISYLDGSDKDHNIYSSDKNLRTEYYIYSDYTSEMKSQYWKKLTKENIQPLLSSAGSPAGEAKAKEVFVNLDDDPDNIPTINFARHATHNLVSDQGYDLTLLFADKAFNHKTKEIREIRHSDFASILGKKLFHLQRAYDNESEYQQACKTLDSYFKGISNGKRQRQKLLKQVCLASLLGYKPEGKAINLYGKGGTGKSSFVHLCVALAGHINSAKVNYQGMQDDNRIIEMQNKHLIYSEEGNGSMISRSDNVKQLLIGESVVAVAKYMPAQDVNIANAVIIQAYNEPPKFKTKTDNSPLVDRMKLVIFEKDFRHSPKRRDDSLMQKIKSNSYLPYVARYLIENVPAFTQFADSGDEMTLNEQINDTPMNDFIDNLDSLGVLDFPAIPLQDLYGRYKEWFNSTREGSNMLAQRTFSTRITDELRDRGFINSQQANIGNKTRQLHITWLNNNGYLNYALYDHILNEELPLFNHHEVKEKQSTLIKQNYISDTSYEYNLLKEGDFETKHRNSFIYKNVIRYINDHINKHNKASLSSEYTCREVFAEHVSLDPDNLLAIINDLDPEKAKQSNTN